MLMQQTARSLSASSKRDLTCMESMARPLLRPTLNPMATAPSWMFCIAAPSDTS